MRDLAIAWGGKKIKFLIVIEYRIRSLPLQFFFRRETLIS